MGYPITLTWAGVILSTVGFHLISVFLFKYFTNKKFRNFGTSNDIDMKLRALFKLDKRNTPTLVQVTMTF